MHAASRLRSKGEATLQPHCNPTVTMRLTHQLTYSLTHLLTMQNFAKPELCVGCKPRTFAHATKVADAAATLGLSKFGAGQKDAQGRVMLSPEQVTDFVKLLAKDESLGERRVQSAGCKAQGARGCQGEEGLGLRVRVTG